MAGWSSMALARNLLRVFSDLKRLIRQYNARAGVDATPSCSFLKWRSKATGGLRTLPGLGRAVATRVWLPGLISTLQPPHLPHLPLPLAPFAALPISWHLPDAPSQARSPSGNGAAGAGIQDVPTIRALANLRATCEELEGDPLWQFSMDGTKASCTELRTGQDDAGDLEEVMYDFVTLRHDASDVCGAGDMESGAGQGAGTSQDPFGVLLEWANLGSEEDLQVVPN